MSKAPFVVQPQLTAVTLAYRNERMIADDVLPRVQVDADTFKYTKYTVEDAFTIPNTRVGRKSQVNEIDWSASESTVATSDYGLEDAIPQADIDRARNAPRVSGVMPVDPLARSTELLTDLVALDREKRTADTVFNASTYPAANKTTLSGTGQWSDFTNSDPVSAILTAMDTMLIRPNKLVLGRAVWTKLQLHPKIVAAAFPLGGNATAGGGKVARQALADLLELDEIVVGEGWYNSAKKGQTPSLARLWGKHASLIYSSPLPSGPQGGVTFGFTGEWGNRIAGTIENDPDIGLRGGTRVRVGESVVEVVCASDTGYFFQNAIA